MIYQPEGLPPRTAFRVTAEMEMQHADDEREGWEWASLWLAIISFCVCGLLMGCSSHDSSPSEPELAGPCPPPPGVLVLSGFILDGEELRPVYVGRPGGAQ